MIVCEGLMERYNYELLRRSLLAKLTDEDWMKMPFKRQHVAKAEVLGVPLSQLRRLVALVGPEERLDPKWVGSLANAIAEAGIDDHDGLDHVLLLKQYEPTDIDPLTNEPKFVPQIEGAVVLHLHNRKMAQIAGAAFFDTGEPPKLVYRRHF